MLRDQRNTTSLSRREFLKLSALGAGGLLFDLPPWEDTREEPARPVARGRVTTQAIYRYRRAIIPQRADWA